MLNKAKGWWGFVLRNEDGRIVGYGRVKADDRIEAVSRARLVHLQDVTPAIPPGVAAAQDNDSVTPISISDGLVLEWTSSKPAGA